MPDGSPGLHIPAGDGEAWWFLATRAAEPRPNLALPKGNTMDLFDVIIAGCGPTGATLAAELRLHDVRVLLLEKETEPVSFVRIVSLHARSLELMAMRGLLDRLLERGRQRPVGGIFAGIPKPPPQGMDTAYAYLLGIPQPAIENLLERTPSSWARRSGAVVRWSVSTRTTRA